MDGQLDQPDQHLRIHGGGLLRQLPSNSRSCCIVSSEEAGSWGCGGEWKDLFVDKQEENLFQDMEHRIVSRKWKKKSCHSYKEVNKEAEL